MEKTKKNSHKNPIRKRISRKKRRNVHKKLGKNSYKKIKGGNDKMIMIMKRYDQRKRNKDNPRIARQELLIDLDEGIQNAWFPASVINFADSDGCTLLHLVCFYKDIETLKELFENYGDNIQHDTVGMIYETEQKLNTIETTPLGVACRMKFEYGIELLIAKGADVNKCLVDGKFPFIWTEKIVNSLARSSYEGDINVRDEDGFTPLHAIVRKAIQYAHPTNMPEYKATIGLLIKKHGNLTAGVEIPEEKEMNELYKQIYSSGYYGETPLSAVCKSNKDDVFGLLEYIIEQYQEHPLDQVSVEDVINSTSEYKTVNNKNEVIVVNEMTPLHYAARYGTHKTVDFLIGKGADANAVDEKGWTPLRHACEREKEKKLGETKKVVEALFDKTTNETGITDGNQYCQQQKKERKWTIKNMIRQVFPLESDVDREKRLEKAGYNGVMKPLTRDAQKKTEEMIKRDTEREREIEAARLEKERANVY